LEIIFRMIKYKRTSLIRGKVFYILLIKEGQKKKIYNTEVIDEIKNEIKRLKNH